MSGRTQLLDRLERFYDAIPRSDAVATEYGGLVLFTRSEPGWPYYARPRLGGHTPPSLADIAAVRARQRELGLPEAFEWVHETTPDLLATAERAGLAVLRAPLLVLDPTRLPGPDPRTDLLVRLLDPREGSFAADVALQQAVAGVAFGTAGTARGPAGIAERDAVLRPLDPEQTAVWRRRVDRGRNALALAQFVGDAATPGAGAVASGMLQRVTDVAEIVGIATLPRYRRRGLGAAMTAYLARHAITTGVDLVFLSAGSEDVARVYTRVGFHRVGTACIAEPAPPAAAPA